MKCYWKHINEVYFFNTVNTFLGDYYFLFKQFSNFIPFVKLNEAKLEAPPPPNKIETVQVIYLQKFILF